MLSRLRAIPHLEFIRIGSKQPVVQPMRVTPALTKMLRRYHPLWMSLHFTHPDEVTPEVAEACGRLADAGIPLGSQTVLLKGVNDDVATLKKLFHALLKIRVRPYYLYQCDPDQRLERISARRVDKGLELIAQLRGYTTGYAVPNYVVDAPGGGGKIAMLPDAVIGRDGDDLLLRNFRRRAVPLSRTRRYARQAISLTAPHARTKDSRVRIGLTYDLKDDYLALGLAEHEVAEFDSAATIDAIAGALDGARATTSSASATCARSPRGSSPAGAATSCSTSPRASPASAANRRCPRCSRPTRFRTRSPIRWSAR